MKFIGYYIFLLLFVNISVAEKMEQIHSILSRDVYNPIEGELPIIQAVVPIVNQSTNNRGTAFFISPNRLITSFHGICCFKGPINETLYIITKEKGKVEIDKLIYASSYQDWVLLEINDFSAEHFLNLSVKDNIEIQNDIHSFGYKYYNNNLNVIRLKGKIIDKTGDLYGGTFNFYQLYGFSGAPIIYGDNNEVVGIISMAVTNIAYIMPVSKITEIIHVSNPCSDSTSCQANALRFLVDRAESDDAQAQFILSTFLYKNREHNMNFEYFLEQSILDEPYYLSLLYRSSQIGYSHSMVEWGRILMLTGNSKDYISAGNYFLEASKQDNILAHFFRGAWLLEQMKNAISYSERIYFQTETINSFEQAASAGHVTSQLTLAQMYYNKYKEGKADKTEFSTEPGNRLYEEIAMEWLRRAENENNHPEAMQQMWKILME